MFEEIIKTYNEAIFDTDRDRALQIVHDAVDKGVSPEDILFNVVLPAIELISISETFDANLAQHFMTSQIGAEVVEEMIPRFSKTPDVVGRVVIRTSQSDFHGLGKRIVTRCLSARMINVTDLGLNVPPERGDDAPGAVAVRKG